MQKCPNESVNYVAFEPRAVAFTNKRLEEAAARDFGMDVKRIRVWNLINASHIWRWALFRGWVKTLWKIRGRGLYLMKSATETMKTLSISCTTFGGNSFQLCYNKIKASPFIFKCSFLKRLPYCVCVSFCLIEIVRCLSVHQVVQRLWTWARSCFGDILSIMWPLSTILRMIICSIDLCPIWRPKRSMLSSHTLAYPGTVRREEMRPVVDM